MKDRVLLQALAGRAQAVLEGFDGLSLSLLLQGVTKARFRCPELLGAVAAGIASEEEVAAQPGEISKIVAAFAAFEFATEESKVRRRLPAWL